MPNKRASCGSKVGVAFVSCAASAGVLIMTSHSVCPAVYSRCPCDISTVMFRRLWFNCGLTIANAGTSLAHHCAVISPLI